MLLIYSLDQNSGNALFRLLKNHEFNPVLIRKMDELLDKIRFGQADVVILDLSTSIFFSELNDFFDMTEDIPVVILTPYDVSAKEIINFKKKKLHHFIVKPICTDKLESLLHKLLPKSR